MGRPRIVDRKDARRRFDLGWRISDIASHYGVSLHAIQVAIHPEFDARQRASSLRCAKAKRRPCEVCGSVLVWMHYGPDNPNHAPDGRAVCVRCRGLERAVTVRETTLLCSKCHEWKPDEDFPKEARRIARRERHHFCRACSTIEKREWRLRNAVPCKQCGGPRGADSDYSAEYKRGRKTGLCKTCYQASRAMV